jgi:hypothetical protein
MPSSKQLLQQASSPWTCAACALPYTSLTHHYYHHPDCRPPGLVAADASPEVLEKRDLGADALVALCSENSLRDQVAWDLLGFRHTARFEDCQVDQLKRAVHKWINSRDAAIRASLPEGDALEAATIVMSRLPMFNGIETQKQEMTYAKKGLPYLPLRVKDLSENGGRNPNPNPDPSPSPSPGPNPNHNTSPNPKGDAAGAARGHQRG